MPFLAKIRNWYLIQLTDIHCIGETRTGEIMTDRVDLLDIDAGYLVTKGKIYKLGKPDKVWWNSEDNSCLLEVLP